jgi:hypothetical protein
MISNVFLGYLKVVIAFRALQGASLFDFDCAFFGVCGCGFWIFFAMLPFFWSLVEPEAIKIVIAFDAKLHILGDRLLASHASRST